MIEKIHKNVKKLFDEIGSSVKVVCVTKYVDVVKTNEVIKAGAKIIGENRINNFLKKEKELLECSKHMIGHIQSNKVRKVVKHFDMIQSVDSEKILKLINNEAEKITKVQKVLIQINIGREEQKHGFEIETAREVMQKNIDLKNVKILGFMCIVPKTEKVEETRKYFKEMKKIFNEFKKYETNNKTNNIQMKYLSMGMSRDYKIAIEEGANMIRVGSKLFK